MNTRTLFTVGHSSHPPDYFLELLREYKITCLIDVRSVAASAYNPQYNKEPLAAFLNKNGIQYLHFSKEFGARHTEPELLDENGKVDFEKVRNSDSFKEGVQRLIQGLDKGFIISLMCSEAEPLDCHRFSMVSVALSNAGFEINHILKDKSLATNAQLENALFKKFYKKLPVPTFFEPDVTIQDQIKAAYRLKNQEIAFSPYTHNTEENL
ncbi:DUF488 domain-containing protein [Dyadobacter frigoris]|uniref:DUF488 domain-containing protein n=1 Tax=Dyadobacter frigoris TaxID=2576211 RepID=A0A4U6CNU5_9BACT|nr:DUF488 domain-containing protein [Dyadobacter frigoris]TKT85097.1 DUF488 domain-containing protein [Dyadobacter frigoris]GLU57302.1 hypothetical protein Dfri01_67630 [Dyadobacter frigoris]